MKLRGAIIGCGSIYGNHAEALTRIPGAELAAVCDNDEAALRRAAERYGCKAYGDWRDLLRDPSVDVIHICAPHFLHAEMAIAAMRAGKHVFCEKPAAIRSEDAVKMAETSEALGKKLGICFQNRMNDTSVMIRDALDSGRLGAVLGAKASVTWRRGPKYYTESKWRGKWATEGGGVLINQSIHTLDLLQWLLGPVESLKAHTDRYTLADYIEVEDTADVFLRFQSGAKALFYATNSYAANSPVELELVCERATVKLADKLTITYADGTCDTCGDEVDHASEKAYWGTSHERLIARFYGCVEDGSAFPVDGREGIPSIRIIEAVYRSAASGEFVTISA